MVEFVIVSTLERSIKSTFIIMLVLLTRKTLNVKSIKWADIILWSILFIYLLFPFSILIQIEGLEKYVILQYLLKPFVLISIYIKMFVQEVGYILSNLNQLMVTSILLIYTGVQVTKRNKALRNSVRIELDSRIEELVNSFRLKRRVQIYINDSIKVPITYGVICPKIIIQSQVLEDNSLLKYVIIHEMIHIKKFDIVLTHIKNLIACLHWYNPFILVASRYMEDDLELLCDKLVIQRVGDTIKNRKEYCLSMLRLVELKEIQEKSVLKLHPTKERMIIMKKWKRGLSGICTLILMIALSMTVFADIGVNENNPVIEKGDFFQEEVLEDDMVRAITEEEYEQLTLEEIPPIELNSANIDDNATLEGLAHKSYKFNMASWTQPNHNGFTVKISNASSYGGVMYNIIINQNGNTIYNRACYGDATLTVNAQNNSRYEVVILNASTNSLKYRAKINSYMR
ncbi:M56 family metallopeptidase [Lachnoanaerobaculum sp. Marseille-Q4761]|uniref:M56 family metallopeptidase n=1 Tax=Lachnoanaerobaculum sp. Marseille-Q4761 TaxID=2819511 RepID=UPI001AA19FAE|nr:M56 family metallopeptidase [Lachnoanaerobaculum sp. Marseille-Q4761]MBO1869387.1 M56 family metallopeptidase [Lachnoanaerobaculum sp. Marseille-Q4761]